jgi:hypothetical protein
VSFRTSGGGIRHCGRPHATGDGAINLSRRDSCCLTRLFSRSGPRKADTIGISPVLLRAWKRQRFRDRCDDRSVLQGIDVCRWRENARSEYCDDGKREDQFLGQSHLLTHCLICLSTLNAPFRRLVGATDTRHGFQDGCVRCPIWLRGEQK